jgi:hypothetical protein
MTGILEGLYETVRRGVLMEDLAEPESDDEP